MASEIVWFIAHPATAIILSCIIGAIQSRGLLPTMKARVLLAIAWLFAVITSGAFLVEGAPFSHRLIVGLGLVGVPFLSLLVLFEWWMARSASNRKLSDLGTSRTEFLLESVKPLKEVSIVIDLTHPVTPEELEHFRVLVCIADVDVDSKYAEPVDVNYPHPVLCVGGRDSYPTATFNEKSVTMFGVHNYVWALNPTTVMQSTSFFRGERSVSKIRLWGGIYRKGPFKALADLEDHDITVYVTASLFPYISSIQFIGNNYLLMSQPADNLAQLNGLPLVEWLGDLTPSEREVNWIAIMPKGADFEKFNQEKLRLGHDPEWFPANLYRPWGLNFAEFTPRRLTPPLAQ